MHSTRNCKWIHEVKKVPHKVKCVFCVRWRTGIEAVSGCGLWAVAGGLSLAWTLWDRTGSDLHGLIDSKCQLHKGTINQHPRNVKWGRWGWWEAGLLTGAVVLLVHGGSIPASPCHEGGRSKSPPPSSCSPSPGLGDKEPSYNKHNQIFITVALQHHDISRMWSVMSAPLAVLNRIAKYNECYWRPQRSRLIIFCWWCNSKKASYPC